MGAAGTYTGMYRLFPMIEKMYICGFVAYPCDFFLMLSFLVNFISHLNHRVPSMRCLLLLRHHKAPPTAQTGHLTR